MCFAEVGAARRPPRPDPLRHRSRGRPANATGEVEGVCRHLVADHLGFTGTRWDSTVPRPSSISALITNGGFED
ncbi:hypothetical protein [Streptomyces justiciae]|uniref:Uncharacterized protein n=1 Tax=Streptomyces justiciae TaxID=2780140 RepID=A0ABU3M9J5_9ACTN|nr:hypothetical protein [Streptomyces justiciae]MDT7847537.1 hypothetical protein [Streptomyces justiciae]